MLYSCGDKILNIPSDVRLFGKGSEGKVYLLNNKLYKIYYPSSIDEGYGSKEKHHFYLSSLDTKQIVLPEELIYDEFGNYAGYSSSIANGSQRDKTGIILMNTDDFLANLKTLENDFKILSDNYVVGADISPVNYILDQDDSIMRIIDPGRYRHHVFLLKNEYYIQNRAQFEYLLDMLIKIDIIRYKPIDTKKKQLLMSNLIQEKRKNFNGSMIEFYENELAGYESFYEYSKSLTKYIK